jgi:hypothetical protein
MTLSHFDSFVAQLGEERPGTEATNAERSVVHDCGDLPLNGKQRAVPRCDRGIKASG